MLTHRFEKALSFACQLHATQNRKGGKIPYIAHLLSVTGLVLENGGGEDDAIAALLHDSIEDSGDDYPGGRGALRQKIEQDYGANVLAIVNACTDDDHFPKPVGEQPGEPSDWRRRKEAYLEHIPHLSESARRVSCSDKVHNARSLLADYRAVGDELWKRFRTRSRDDQLWYYRGLVRAFEEAGGGPLSDELRRIVDDLARQSQPAVTS